MSPTTEGYRPWQEVKREIFGDRPLPPLICNKCQQDAGAVCLPCPCGYCNVWACNRCGYIDMGTGPVFLADMDFTLFHDMCGFRGHHTLAEQPKYPVAVKGHRPKKGRVWNGRHDWDRARQPDC